MRKKPVEERRRFVVFWTVVIMAVVTAVWFVLFFMNVSNQLQASRALEEAKAKIPMTFDEKKNPLPF
jgi:ribosomal protein L16/L10AE